MNAARHDAREMPDDEEVDYRNAPMGPFSPPLPKTAESDEKEPMAVRSDKDTDRQSFLPTSANLDAFDEDVARKYRPEATEERMLPKSDEETREMQSPEGYTKTDKRGFRHPSADEIDEKY